jgi:hypothetical protein
MVFLWSRSRGSFSSGKFIAPLSLGRPRRLFQSNRSARNRLISHGRAAGIADMKKFLILCGLILTATPDAFAQAGGYRFDNFDTSEGVKVVVPEAPAAGRKSRKRLRLTARAGVRDGPFPERRLAVHDRVEQHGVNAVALSRPDDQSVNPPVARREARERMAEGHLDGGRPRRPERRGRDRFG